MRTGLEVTGKTSFIHCSSVLTDTERGLAIDKDHFLYVTVLYYFLRLLLLLLHRVLDVTQKVCC